MIAQFYNNKSNHNVINKTLEPLYSTTLSLKNNTSLINPTLLLQGYNGGNYLYIDELDRYYYIDNVILTSGGLSNLDCSVDVLMSYKAELNDATYYNDSGVLTFIDSDIDFNTIYNPEKFLLILGG